MENRTCINRNSSGTDVFPEKNIKLLLTYATHACESDGQFYNSSESSLTYERLARYHKYIRDIVLVLRCRKVDSVNPSEPRIDREGVTVMPIPDPKTPALAILLLPKMVWAVLKAIMIADRYYLRLPEPTATLVGLVLLLLRKKYVVEVVADSKKGILFAKKDMFFVRFYASLFDALTKFLIRRAHCVAYISQYLQDRYPPKLSQSKWIICSVELNKEIIGRPKTLDMFREGPFRIFSVGRFSAEKGHIYLVRAFKKICEKADINVELHLVGNGPERNRLEEEVRRLDLSNNVHFHGYIRKEQKLFALLDSAHLYVMPSLTEGMGRGLIEAMARGLPCLGSSVGGIPEYLDSEMLFRAGDAEAIADKIIPLLGNPDKLAQISLRNFEFSKAFWPEALEEVKRDFWRHVVQCCK